MFTLALEELSFRPLRAALATALLLVVWAVPRASATAS